MNATLQHHAWALTATARPQQGLLHQGTLRASACQASSHPGRCCCALVGLLARDGPPQGGGLLLSCRHLALKLRRSFAAAAVPLLSSLHLLGSFLHRHMTTFDVHHTTVRKGPTVGRPHCGQSGPVME